MQLTFCLFSKFLLKDFFEVTAPLFHSQAAVPHKSKPPHVLALPREALASLSCRYPYICHIVPGTDILSAGRSGLALRCQCSRSALKNPYGYQRSSRSVPLYKDAVPSFQYVIQASLPQDFPDTSRQLDVPQTEPVRYHDR